VRGAAVVTKRLNAASGTGVGWLELLEPDEFPFELAVEPDVVVLLPVLVVVEDDNELVGVVELRVDVLPFDKELFVVVEERDAVLPLLLDRLLEEVVCERPVLEDGLRVEDEAVVLADERPETL
jgi:hypothetical protein